MIINIFTDGAARGNPGPGGIGVLLCKEDNSLLEEAKEYIGNSTNNIAEYKALILGLKLAKKYLPCRLKMHLDSELVCRQMSGIYKVKDENLLMLFEIAKIEADGFDKVEFIHIPREKNKHADRLANQALDAWAAGNK
jgi:ribonuclease HI